MREWIARDDAVSLLADDNGKLVGSLGLELAAYGVAELGMLVAADRRGEGIGSALLDAGIEWARSAGAHKVALQLWPHNAAALGLYRKYGFAEGDYDARPDDGLALRRVRITNAVRCVPPQNKPEPSEIANCRRFLFAEINAMPRLRAILALGAIAHHAVLDALGFRRALFPFEHGRLHDERHALAAACAQENVGGGIQGPDIVGLSDRAHPPVMRRRAGTPAW